MLSPRADNIGGHGREPIQEITEARSQYSGVQLRRILFACGAHQGCNLSLFLIRRSVFVLTGFALQASPLCPPLTYSPALFPSFPLPLLDRPMCITRYTPRSFPPSSVALRFSQSFVVRVCTRM
jgi:hypothetical protein